MTPNAESRVADPDADRTAGGQRRPDEHWLALIGNPNTGKTTIFNALTGGWARTGNYPGVTVDRRVGNLRAATVVFRLDGPQWRADGRALFNLNPAEAIAHFQHELETVE